MKTRIVLSLLSFIVLANSVSAQLVTLSSTQTQTVAGEVFLFQFLNVPAPVAGADAKLTFSARGDFSIPFSVIEFADIDVESVFSATGIAPSNSMAITQFGFDDNAFTREFTLSAADFSTVAADGQIDVIVDFSDQVSVVSGSSFASVSLMYAIPEPSTIALFGVAALVALIALRRRFARR